MPPAGTLAGEGDTMIVARIAALTVSCCVALVYPAALAVKLGLPALVSS